MGIFHSSPPLTPTEEIEKLAQEQKVLRSRRQNSPKVINKFLLFLISLTGALFVYFNFFPNMIVLTFAALSVIVFLVKPFWLKSIERQILAKKNLQKKKADELKKSVDNAGEFYNGLKQKERDIKKSAMDYSSYSPLCAIWDKLTGSYIYNPNALICPRCKANNGLFDMTKPISYICPNCNCRVYSNFDGAASAKKAKAD